MSGHDVSSSYNVASREEAEAAYENWAQDYEADLCKSGYRLPAVTASAFVRFVPQGTQPILDAGCGGGIQAEPLALLGYGPIIGIDFSRGMLEIARRKNIYAGLRRMVLGEPLDFPDGQFKAVISCGCITPGHAPAHSFDELIRVCASGGMIAFSLRDDEEQLPEYPNALRRLTATGAWKQVFSTDSFQSMPYGEPHISHRIYVYQV